MAYPLSFVPSRTLRDHVGLVLGHLQVALRPLLIDAGRQRWHVKNVDFSPISMAGLSSMINSSMPGASATTRIVFESPHLVPLPSCATAAGVGQPSDLGTYRSS